MQIHEAGNLSQEWFKSDRLQRRRIFGNRRWCMYFTPAYADAPAFMRVVIYIDYESSNSRRSQTSLDRSDQLFFPLNITTRLQNFTKVRL